MKLSKRLIERYIAAAIIPYTLMALLLLTAVLVAQQGSRFAELLGQVQAPLAFIFEITISIIPGLLLFTIPMAILAGTLIGFSRMGSDSELTALRAAGTGTTRLLTAPIMVGLCATIATLYLGVFYTPIAAGRLRDVTLRAALSRLKSPIQPGTLTTNLGNKVIYVQRGDDTRGEWHGALVFSQETDGRGLLITAERGRLDSSSDVAELVLYDTVASTFNLPLEQTNTAKYAGKETPVSESKQLVSERSAYLRVKLDEKLGTLIERLRSRQPELDELAWVRLLEIAREDANAKQRRTAQIVLHKKLALGVAPLCFAILGAAVGLRVKRGGRGIGMLLSLGVMLIYYLMTLAGEQMARSSIVSVPLGVWLASGLTLLSALALLLVPHLSLAIRLKLSRNPSATTSDKRDVAARRYVSHSLYTLSSLATALFGLLDRTLLTSLAFNFAFALCALTSVFLVFTLFELWRHIAANNVGWQVVAEYLLFLIPFVAISLASVSVLVSTIFSYAVLARRSEAVAWLASGQSIYRLLFPGLLLAGIVGGAVWAAQESILPSTNRRQDALRGQIRGGTPQVLASSGRQWAVSPNGDYLFSYSEVREEGNREIVDSPLIFQYSEPKGVRISRILYAPSADWKESRLILSDARLIGMGALKDSGEEPGTHQTLSLPLAPDLFKSTPPKLSHLESSELERLAAKSFSNAPTPDALKARLTLETRTVEAFAPFIMVLLAMPLAMAFGRRSALVSLCAAVLVGVLFWGVSSGLGLLGTYSLLPVGIAAWGTSIIFGVLGFYLLTRTRT